MSKLTIAIAKGRTEKEMYKILKGIGLGDCLDLTSRKLIFEDDLNGLRYIFVKPVDVVTYVEKGMADLGIVGKDVIAEQKKDVYELYDLKFGKCTFVVAGYPGTNIYEPQREVRVATKYPNITQEFFKDKQKIDVIYLNGSVELAPIMDLSDVIVDLYETGNTLKANGLVVLEWMFDVTAKVISNRVSYRFHYEKIQELLKKLEGRGGTNVENS